MGCTKKENNPLFSNLELSKIGNESIVNANILFCNNGKSVIVNSGSSCELYNVATGEQVKKLFICKSRIICCSFHPLEKNIVIALSEEGELVKYDIESYKLRRRKKLKFDANLMKKQNMPTFVGNGTYEWDNEILNDMGKRKFLYGMPVNVENFQNILYWTSWSLNDETLSHVTVFGSSGEQLQKVNLPRLPLKKCYKNFGVCRTSDKEILYVGMGVYQIEVYLYTYGGLITCIHQTHIVARKVELTCLTLFPKELSIATADSRGMILVWKNILNRRPIKTSYLWHTVNINDLAVSDEGVYLYSGGDENVLVKWSFLTNQKNFLPRLSSPVLRIAVAEEYSLVAISLADNEIVIIDPNFEKISVIKKYSVYMPSYGKINHHVFTFDPRSDNLVVNGTVGQLQFISPQNNFKTVYSLDVGRTNFMTGNRNLVNINITHAKFNKNGSLLVTAEERNDILLKESRLKFWHYNEEKQCFVLNTNMELPHDENSIHSLEISSDDVVATSGSDKQFKLWAQFETNDLNVTKTVWSLFSVGKYKLLPAGPIDFCDDATLIAAGFGPSLTLWDTKTCAMKCSLVVPFKRDHLKFIKFGKEEHLNLIVTATDYNITTWNIITLTMCWTVDLEVSYVVADFFRSYMCAFSKNGTLFVFSPGSTSPELIMENVCQEVVAAHSAFYVNNENSPFQLYFINSKRELFYLKSKEDDKRKIINDVTGIHVTPFSAMTAQKTGGSVKKSVYEYIPTKSRRNSHYMSSILDAPAHTLQNPLRFCSDFLESLTETVQKVTKPSDGKVKEATKSSNVFRIDDSEDKDEVIEIVDISDNDEVSNEVSEKLLWATVNKLFK